MCLRVNARHRLRVPALRGLHPHDGAPAERRVRSDDRATAPKEEDPQPGRRTAAAGAPRRSRRALSLGTLRRSAATNGACPGTGRRPPELLLLDEPFGALDVKVRQELRQWLRRRHDEVHATTIFVTHDQEEALEIADEIIVMIKGRVEQPAARDSTTAPSNEFVMTFLGPVNRLGDALLAPS